MRSSVRPVVEASAAPLGRGEAFLGPLRNERPLLLRQRGEYVEDEGVNIGAKLGYPPEDAAGHQRLDVRSAQYACRVQNAPLRVRHP
jgi:hypothetical protein